MSTSPTVDMENLMGDIWKDQEELKYFRQIQEEARLFAEKQMREAWDRKDVERVASFYNWMIEFIFDHYIMKRNEVQA